MSATQVVVSLQSQQLPATAIRLTPSSCAEPVAPAADASDNKPAPLDHNANDVSSPLSSPTPATIEPTVASDADAQQNPPVLVRTASPTANNTTTSTATKRPHSAADDAGRSAVPTKKSRPSASQVGATKKLFIYGNYDRYYGYRNAGNQSTVVIGCRPDFHDIRLDAFRAHAHLFEAADCLDIGCNRGTVSLAVAARLGARSMVGIDIDQSLVGQARLQLAAEKRKLVLAPTDVNVHRFPHNVYFKHGNYVLSDAALLDLERPQFDTILCLSITKWIHLNFGDAGLKLAFKRMFRQLRCGGRMVLEAQPWQGYKRRKKLTAETERHFGEIALRPDAFEAYLLSDEVGFVRCWRMEAPAEHAKVGFRRPLVVFEKPMREPE